MKEIMELVGVSTAERPIKGFALDKALYVANTKQDVLDEQAISSERVANLVVWAKDIAKFMVFNEDGTSHEEKDFPSGAGELDNYVEKYSKAELNYIQLAYDGKYGDGRTFYPIEIKQDANGWTQEHYTGVRIFQSKDKNSGALGDKVLELGTSRVDLNKPAYVQGKRVAERTTHNIYNTYSLSDLIKPDSESFTDWMTNNPDYTQIQFLNTLFSCTVLGSSNWVVSATTSGEDYNGTFPSGYQQIEIHRNGGGSRSFLRSYNKESSIHYFANYKANTELSWKQYAYTNDLVALKDKVSYDNEIQNINTNGSGVFAEYLGFGSTSSEHTHTFDESGVFWISNLQSSTRNKVVNVASSNGSELTGISVPFNRVVKFTYSSEIEEIITEASYADVDLNSSPTDSTFDGEGFGVPGKTLVEAGTVVQTEITGNYRNNSDAVGDLTINVRTDNGVKNWRFYYSIPRGSISARKLFVKVDEKAGTTKTINSGETWQCEVKAGQFFDEFFWSQIMDSASTFITPEETALLIEENNDEIITPNQGTQFQLVDSDKSSGYGDNGSITYYGPSYSDGQSSKLVNNLDNSKSYFVHRETGSTHGFAMLHESYVSQIYNQDLTGISELTMLFGPEARGRYAKSNQVTPAGMVLNWNGEYLPDTEDPNNLNPSSWIDLAGNVTQEWSSTGIKTACYSSGLLVNDGSALLQRGDVFCHDNSGVKTSTFIADSDSEFFVIPIKVGGGTFNDLKIFPLFMSRLYGTQNEWDSYTFDNSSDAIGALLRISYDAAVKAEENSIQSQQDDLLEGLAFGRLYIKELQVG